MKHFMNEEISQDMDASQSKSKELNKEDSRHFTYVNYLKNREVIFECEAKNILEADELYKKAIGKDPAKQSDVGCTVEKIK